MDFDTSTEVHLQLLYPDFSHRLYMALEEFFAQTQLKLRITEGYRSFSRQAELFAQGRSKPGHIVTHAVAGLSSHHYGVAADVCVAGVDPYYDHHSTEEKERIWKRWGDCVSNAWLIWGGGFSVPDLPHVEKCYGLKLSDIHDLFVSGGLSAVWSRFDTIRGVAVGTEWNMRQLINPNQ